MRDLRSIAVALGGEIYGGQVLAPGPGHSKSDRSMSVRLSPGAPDGFLAFSHAGDTWQVCRDHVRQRLGIERKKVAHVAPPKVLSRRATKPHEAEKLRHGGAVSDDSADKTADAIALFRESVDPRGTAAETYFKSRALDLADIAGRVIRWNSRIGAAVALFRNIETGTPQAVSRIFLDAEARKLRRMFMGPTRCAAVMLDSFDSVTAGLHIAEGIETGQAARQLCLRPTWALGSAGAIAALPVLGGVECLTLLAENDEASARAVETCGTRWHEAGREVLVTRPFRGKDLNDAIRGAA